ncbi:MAG: deoxyribonuclease IV [Candidatus Dadabacteria bacterium]|nr:MAG: deoxyribonuclease IV [Candidatus Dadabacteria bacterium]
MRIGPHVSAAGGVSNAPGRAAELGATAFGLFVKNQRQWQAPPLASEEVDAFRDALEQHRFSPGDIVPHASYLLNLGSPDPAQRERSRTALLDEVTRCQQLGLVQINIHPGSTKGEIERQACLDHIVEGIDWVLERSERVAVLVENTAGQGSSVGNELADLGWIVRRVTDSERIGVCLDTCHLFAAGFDLRTAADLESFVAAFDAEVGLDWLRAWHLNDSRKPLGSRVDRHAPIGDGEIGEAPFGLVAGHPAFRSLPMILETPDSDRWAHEIRRIRELVGYSES